MAWSQTDIDNLKAAIAAAVTSGAKVVQFADGRRVERYSIDEALKLLDKMQSANSGGMRTSYASYSSE